jgi:transcriptional regulator with XRE-family HTH domain
MLLESGNHSNHLTGHALRNAHLRQHSLARAQTAPELARAIVTIRAQVLGLTRLEFSRRSGISRGTLRDLELGVHTPTRRTLQRFVSFCQGSKVSPEDLEALRRLYAGSGHTLEEFIARLELRVGSPRELARRVGISPATLWEYRRGNFPLPLALLRRLCRAGDEDPSLAETLWHRAERQRLLDRGYPEALAEFWVLCARQGFSEKQLFGLGLSTATARRLRYLELPPWAEVAKAAAAVCRDKQEMQNLERLWRRNTSPRLRQPENDFGVSMHQLRKQGGISRRELADLFGIGGKKPARIIKYIEEDGFYSSQAYPAGLASILADSPAVRQRLLDCWQERRRQFHRRHRPEMRTDLRLTRELYGFSVQDMEPILGYTNLEYQKIERGVSPLQETGRKRILDAIHQAGQRRIETLQRHRQAREMARLAWRSPASVRDLISLLAKREGGLIPLMRLLKRAGLKGLWAGRLRAVALGLEIPPWRLLERIGLACGVPDLSQARHDWLDQYRARLHARHLSPLGVEVRLLIAEAASTLRELGARLGFNYSVLVRDLQRLDRDEPLKWFHVERILQAVGLPKQDMRWQEIHALWYTAGERQKKSSLPQPRRRQNSSLKLD